MSKRIQGRSRYFYSSWFEWLHGSHELRANFSGNEFNRGEAEFRYYTNNYTFIIVEQICFQERVQFFTLHWNPIKYVHDEKYPSVFERYKKPVKGERETEPVKKALKSFPIKFHMQKQNHRKFLLTV